MLSRPDDNFFVFRREYDGQAATVVCNFENPSVISVDGGGLPVLSNLGRTELSGAYLPYEAAIAVTD